MDVSMAVCPISAYTKDCVLANAARRWQDWARSTCTGADSCCHWKLPPMMGKVGKESKSSGRCAVLRRLWKNWSAQTAGPGRSTDKTERLRGPQSLTLKPPLKPSPSLPTSLAASCTKARNCNWEQSPYIGLPRKAPTRTRERIKGNARTMLQMLKEHERTVLGDQTQVALYILHCCSL